MSDSGSTVDLSPENALKIIEQTRRLPMPAKARGVAMQEAVSALNDAKIALRAAGLPVTPEAAALLVGVLVYHQSREHTYGEEPPKP